VITDSIGYTISGVFNVDLINNFNSVTGFDYHVTTQDKSEKEWTTIHETLIEEVSQI
jgi:hypothetical protein